MASTTTEIMMQFIMAGGKLVPAECTTIIGTEDALATTNVQGYGPGFTAGNYFLVDSFKFGMTLSDGESKTVSPEMEKLMAAAKDSGGKGKDALHPDLQKALSGMGKSGNESFKRWRSADPSQWDNSASSNTPPYSARINEFSFTRRVDTASTTLFAYCANQGSFDSVSLIKRKSAPVVGENLPQNQAYLRIDFSNVQMSGFQWSDDDVIEESCRFRAQKMFVQFWLDGVDQATQTEGVLVDAGLKATWENAMGKDASDGE